VIVAIDAMGALRLAAFPIRRARRVTAPRRPRAPLPVRVPALAALIAATLICRAESGIAAEPAFLSRLLSPDPGWHATRGALGATQDGLGGHLGNPAALAVTRQARFRLSHLNCGESLAREWVAAGFPLGGGRSLACDAGVLHAAALRGYDVDGRETGALHASEWNAGVTGAWALREGVAVGLGGRYFRLEDPVNPLGAMTASLGLLLRGGTRAVGIAANDLGPRITAAHGAWEPPTCWVLGVEQSDRARRWTLGGGISTRPGPAHRVSCGAVLRPAPGVELLGGYSLEAFSAGPAESGWGSGLAVSQSGFSVSYAVQSSAALGLSHQFGIGFTAAH
jgi:hypothetical protein